MGSSSRRDHNHRRSSAVGSKRSRSESADSVDSREHRRGDQRGDHGRGDRRSGRDDRGRRDDRGGRSGASGGGAGGPPPDDFHCHLCAGPRHWTRDCPFIRSNPRRFPDIDIANGCNQCGKAGHKLANCTNKKYLCKECGGMHTTRECPNSYVPREYHAFFSVDSDRVFYERVFPSPNKELWARVKSLPAISLPPLGTNTTSALTPAELQIRRQQEEKLAAQKEEDSFTKDWSSYGRRCRSPTRPWISWFIQPHDLDKVLWHCPTCRTLQPTSVTLCVGCGGLMPSPKPFPVAPDATAPISKAENAAPKTRNDDDNVESEVSLATSPPR